MGGGDASAKSDRVLLEWKDISYSVQTAEIDDGSGEKGTTAEKVLLHPMSGHAEPGKLLAVMGPSGAGKSTLLDVLAGRIDSSSSLNGELLANNQPVDAKEFRKLTGYVMQSDALFPLMTVRETLRYAAYLRVPNKTTAERNAIADETLSLLRLDECAETIVGDGDNRGISGGQKRRVSVAIDIVHRPAVIFLDEPTSGLDSSTAYTVVDSLKQIARSQNCTVIMTIHQPSAKLFNLIDDVIFLAGGKVTYDGEVSKLDGFLQSAYREANLGEVPMANLPEVFLELCDTLIAEDRLDTILTNKYLPGTMKKKVSNESLALLAEQAAVNDVKTSNTQALSIYANDFFTEIGILFSRSLINFIRVPELFFARVGASCGFGVMLGTLFLFSDTSQGGLQNRMSYFVFTCAFYYYTSLEALPIFLAEREIFQREFSRGTHLAVSFLFIYLSVSFPLTARTLTVGAYRAMSYTISSTIVTFPFMATIATLFTVVTWWLVGLPNIGHVVIFHIFTVFTILVAGSAFATLMSVIGNITNIPLCAKARM